MAQGADGSIIIDTELDTDGFERGAKNLNAKIDELINKVNGMGGGIAKQVGQILPLLSTIAKTTESIFGAMTAGSNQAAAANERARATQSELSESAETAAHSFNQQGQAIDAMTTQATSKLSGLEREVNSFASNVAGISKSAEMGFSNGKSVLAFDAKISAAGEKLSQIKAKLEAFGNTKIPTQDFIDIQNQIGESEKKLIALNARMEKFIETGGSTRSSAFKKMQYDAAELENTILYAKGELEELKAEGKDFTLGANTQQYAQMHTALQRAEAELARNKALIDAEAIAQARLNVLAAQEKVAVAQTAAERKAALSQLQQAQAELSSVAAQSANSSQPPKKSQSGWESLAGVIKKVGNAALVTAGRLAKMSFKAISNGAKKAVGSLKAFDSQSRRTSISTKGLVRQLISLRTMLLTRIKSAFISSITSAVSRGVQSLAQYSSAFNQSMSNIKNSCTQLGGNIAVAFSNILNAIAPAVTAIINLMSEAISYINAFFALISGKSTVTVAKKGMDNYAASTGGAAAAQKELNRQVYGFDELNKRNKESDSSGGGGGGGGGGVEYEEKPIDSLLPQSVKDWFERIKEAFKNGDWYGVGYIIAEGLNAAMAVVDNWFNNTLRPLGVTWAGRIAQMLNGLVDGFDWGLLGKTIADGINAAFDIANTFLTTFNFENLGAGVGAAIVSLFERIDWQLVGQTIANGINAAFGFAHGVVKTLDFLSMGKDIATLLNSAVAQADFQVIGETIGKALRGVIQAAFNFVENIDFTQFTEKIKAAGKAFIAEMNAIDPRTGLNGWQELGTAMADAANGIVQAFESLPWGDIAKGVGETLSTFLSKSSIEVKLVLAALTINGISKILFGQGLLSLVATKIGSSLLTKLSTVWPSLGGMVKTAIGNLGAALSSFASTEVLAASAGQIGAAILSGIFIGGSIGKLIDNHIIGPLIEALGGDQVLAELYKNFHWFGEGGFFDQMWDESSSFLENVKIWGQALGLMFSDIWSGIKSAASSAWSGIKSTLSGAWSGIKSVASSAWSGIKNTVTSAFTNTKNTLTNIAGGIKSGLSSAWSSVKNTATSTWSNIKSGVSNAFNLTRSSLSSTASNIKSGLSSAWSSVKSTATSTWNNIKSGVTSAFNNTKNALSSTANNIKSTLSSAWSSVKNTATQTWSNIKSSVSSTFTNLKSNLSGTANNIKSTVSNAWSSIKSTATSKWSEIKSTVSEKWSSLKSTMSSVDFKSVGTNLVSGLKSGITNAWSGLTSSVGNLCSSLLSKVKGAFGIHSPSRAMAEIGGYLDAGMAQGIEQNKGRLLSTASNLAESVTDRLTPANPEIDVTANGTVTSLTTIADRLSGIAGIFMNIANTLSSMGGLVVPQIATGTVVPYKTKVDGGGSDAPTAVLDPEAIKRFASDVDERLADERYLLQQILAAIRALHLDIDIDALTRAITRQQRERELNFGGV